LPDAEKLTDRVRDPVEWARVQFAIAWVLYDQGRYGDSEVSLRKALRERERSLGPEDPDTLTTRHRLAIALYLQGKAMPWSQWSGRTVKGPKNATLPHLVAKLEPTSSFSR
jgi:hypothetical protein